MHTIISYVGQFKSLDIKNNELTERIAEMKHEFDIGALKISSDYEQKLLQKDVVIAQKDTEIAHRDAIISQKDNVNTSLKKDIEILKLQNDFSNHKFIIEISRLKHALETQNASTSTNTRITAY